MIKLDSQRELVVLSISFIIIVTTFLLCAFAPQEESELVIADETEAVREISVASIEESTEPKSEETEAWTETAAQIQHSFETLFTNTRSNIRAGAGLDQEVIDTVDINTQLTVIDYSVEDTWSLIEYADCQAYIFTELLSYTITEIKEPPKAAYYGIWSGAYWHFTPEEIDNQWRGMKKSKQMLPSGTTRAWQQYLFDRLTAIGCAWFYKYAVAQAMQESGMNPLNNIDHSIISWLNGRATYDCGLFSFKDIYWNSAYGDVCDYRANINAYVDRVKGYIVGSDPSDFNQICVAIAQHYDPYVYHQAYVDAVLGRLNELWEVE